MTPPPRTLIVVATYNEIENLPRLVAGIHQHAAEADILVIDDNSPDGTGQWCNQQAAADTHFRVIHRPGKLGLGSATITGLQFAIDENYEWVVTMDADLSHDPVYLPALFAAGRDASSPADVVIGSRYIAGGSIKGWPWRRRRMSRCINWYARWMLRLQPHDCSGAYRSFRVEFLKQLDFSQIRSRGFSFLEEILWVLQRQGAVIREVPITFVDRTLGKSKINYREAWQAVRIVFCLSLQRKEGR